MWRKRLMWTAGIILICLIGMIGTLFICGGIFTKEQYLEPWDKTYYQKFDDARLKLAAHGILAANAHNMQPWKIKLDPSDQSLMYLYADPDRYPAETDPLSRQTMVSQGTFLEYVRAAGEKLGYKTQITLFPNGIYDENNLEESMRSLHAAAIKITKAQTGESNQNSNKVNNWYQAIYQPDTNRCAYKDIIVNTKQIKTLKGICKDNSRISIQVYTEQKDIKQLGEFAMKGVKIESGVKRVMKEQEVIFRSNEQVKNKYRYGFSVEGQGTTGAMKYLMQGLLTIFPSLNEGKAAVNNYIKASKTQIANTPAYVMITSKDNSREAQIESGIYYSRLVLASQSLGLAIQPLSQSLEEYPEMKEIYQDIHNAYAKNGETIQMLVRIGVPTKKAVQSMRQDLSVFLLK